MSVTTKEVFMSAQQMDVYLWQLMDAKKVLTPARASDDKVSITSPERKYLHQHNLVSTEYSTGCPQCHHKESTYISTI